MVKISDLAAITALDEDDIIPVVEDGVTKKVTIAQLRSALAGIIYDEILSGDTASFDIQSIPSTYKHLEIVADLRATNADIQTDLRVRFNNDSGSNYNTHYQFNTSGAASGITTNNGATSSILGLISGDTAAANRSGSCLLLIPNYASTTFQKAIQSHTGYSRGSDWAETWGSGHWANTAAINRVTVLPGSGSWKAGSRLTIYGRS